VSPKRTKNKTLTNIGASVRARLLNIAKKSKRDYNRILVQYAQERLLYRFSVSTYRDNFILKGALLFLTYDMPQHRPTKDIDFLGKAVKNDLAEIKKVMKEVASIKVDDGVIFDPATVEVEQIAEQAEYVGIRVSLQSVIGGAKNVMQVDIGFGDTIVAGPLEIEFPTMLDYPAPHIKVYSLESAIAEKFEAIVRLNIVTSRMKDFYDIIYLSQHNSFKADILLEAMKQTFETRNTPIVDRKIIWSTTFKKDESKERQWNAFHTTNKLDLLGTWIDSVEMTERFLEPILEHPERYSQWQPDKFRWQER
jgi:predicted nucleotidyltransferase component of viral defense system